MEYKEEEMVQMSLERYEKMKEDIRQKEQDVEQLENIMNCVHCYNEDGTKKMFWEQHKTGIIEVDLPKILDILGYGNYLKDMEVKLIN